ncbi:MAG: hypothetical protein R3E39_17005 [Anaerolineae bacterium]
MLWLRLFWWVLWRGVLCGAILGAALGLLLSMFYVFSAFVACGYGLILGAVYGGIFGFMLGVPNALALTGLTWWRVTILHTESSNVELTGIVIVIVNALGGYIVLDKMINGNGAFAVVPITCAILVGLYYRQSFNDYGTRELAKRMRRNQMESVVRVG